MGNVIGIISGGCPADLLMGLTKERPIAAVPFGGRYRLLDFPLSGMVNSGLRTVGIITPYNYRPMLDHLGAGKEWLLDRKTGGLFMLPGCGLEVGEQRFLLGDLNLNVDFLEKDKAENVVLACSNLVLNVNYEEILKFHETKKADITLVYKEEDVIPKENSLLLEMEADGKVQSLALEPSGREYKQGNNFLDILIIKRKLLLEMLQRYLAMDSKDLLAVVTEEAAAYKVYAFQFKGYVGRIDSIQSYFNSSMDLLRPEVRRELFMGSDKIRTKLADNPPTRYGPEAAVKNSLIASGCRIEGRVESSIIFREVHIKPGAIVKNSIIMQKSHIGREAILENAILDKFVGIRNRTVIKGEAHKPVVVEKTVNVGSKGVVS